MLDAAIFTGMEGEDGDAATGCEACGQVVEELVEHYEFFVDGDANGLEYALAGVLDFLFVFASEGLVDDFAEARGGGDAVGFGGFDDGTGQEERVGLIGIFPQIAF